MSPRFNSENLIGGMSQIYSRTLMGKMGGITYIDWRHATEENPRQLQRKGCTEMVIQSCHLGPYEGPPRTHKLT